MKTYNIEIQRNLRTTVKVTAESQEQAELAAMEIAKRQDTADFHQYGHKVTGQWSNKVTA